MDGDTLDFVIDLGFGITYSDRLRLYGVDTPEVRGKEKKEGLIVKEFVSNIFEIDPNVKLVTRKWKGKYGRYVCDVYYRKEERLQNLAGVLVNNGMAKEVDY